MWFDPAFITKSKSSPLATSATSATFQPASDCDLPESRKAAKVATPQVSENCSPDMEQEIVQKAVALASEVPDVPRGIFVDEYSDLENVVLFVADLAIRQTFQILIPREKYDPLALLVLVENLRDGTRIRWSGEGPMRLPHWPSGESVAASGPHACTCPACSN